LIDVTYYLAFILVFLRMATFFTLVPLFLPKGTPNTVKIAFAGIISFMLLPGVNYTYLSTVNSNYMLITSCASEISTGLTLGFIVSLCFFSIKFAGQLMDFQIGLSMINMFDPTTSTNNTLVENILYWFSLMVYLIIDGHHMLLRALIESFNIIKLGSFILSKDSILLIIKAFMEFFALGLRIAIPVILIMLLTDITMGLVSRTVPSLNVMILGLPIKLLVGLTTVAFALPMISRFLITSFNTLPDIIKGFYKVIPIFLVFASEDKTEEATPKKKSDARKKGQIPRSKEVGLTLTLITITLVISFLGGYVGNNFKALLTVFLGSNLNMTLDYNSVQKILLISIWRIALTFLPVVVPIMITGVLASFLQSGFLVSGEGIKPQFSKLNPIKGFKKMFSKRTFVELIKDILLISVIGYIGYNFISDNYLYILSFGNLSVFQIPLAFSKLVISIFFKITLLMLVISLADYIFQRYQYSQDLKMTKQEIKEEYKQQEGDPEVKSKIKQKQREMATRRMMQQIPSATVVVTNPTHIAVALRYEQGKDSSPMVVAKGQDNVALKIKEIAKENEVPIIENKALARLIYAEVEINAEIPVDMYEAVAEILALVYKLKKRK
jgi:flagellar biosynthetic protein FliR/FlhB